MCPKLTLCGNHWTWPSPICTISEVSTYRRPRTIWKRKASTALPHCAVPQEECEDNLMRCQNVPTSRRPRTIWRKASTALPH